jgi:hypothetical protein
LGARWAPSVQGAGARARALTSAAAEERQEEEEVGSCRRSGRRHGVGGLPHTRVCVRRPAAAAIVADCSLDLLPPFKRWAMLAASLFGRRADVLPKPLADDDKFETCCGKLRSFSIARGRPH